MHIKLMNTLVNWLIFKAADDLPIGVPIIFCNGGGFTGVDAGIFKKEAEPVSTGDGNPQWGPKGLALGDES